MPEDLFGRGFRFLPREAVLTFEEIADLARAFVALGVRKIRLTGGEPLVRQGVVDLVRMLAGIPGLEDLAMTTNGSLLAANAAALADAGLRRVTVSLDSLDPDLFRRITGSTVDVARVVEGIRAARRAGLRPVKLNTVVKRGVNEAGVLDLARFARDEGLSLRLIEFMDVGGPDGWRVDDVVPAAELRATIDSVYPLEEVPVPAGGEVAQQYRYRDGAGSVGFITSVSQPFCRSCTRARLSADGYIYTCLFAAAGTDLRPILRATDHRDPAALAEAILAVWSRRDDRYSELREPGTTSRPKVAMSFIGG